MRPNSDDAVDMQLETIAATHFDARVAAGLPAATDVTDVADDLVRAVAHLPVITFTRTAVGVPPAEAERGDLTVPEALVEAVLEGISRAPRAALVATQLMRATPTLSIDNALAMESLAYSALQAGGEYTRWRAAARKARELPTPTEPQILVHGTPAHVEVVLNRPDRANALNHVMRHELVEVFTALAPTGVAVTMRGAGINFSAGGDLAEFTAVPDPLTTHLTRSAQNLAGAVARLRDRLTAHVHGPNVGAGVELLAFAGRVIARGDATFRLPEVAMGLLPGCGGTVSLPRRIGSNRALILMLTGQSLDADTALAWGLVDEIEGPAGGAAS